MAFTARRVALRFVGPCAAALTLTVAALVGTGAGAVAGQADWEQTFHDGGHTGYNPSEKALSVSNVSGLQLLWSQDVAGGVTAFALDKGVIFAQGQGASTPNLVAIDAATGAVLWNINTGQDNGYDALAAAQGLVFAGCAVDLSNQQQGICAYKQPSGRFVWSYFVNCNCLPPAGLMAPLVYDQGALEFGYEGGGGDQWHGVVAVDAKSGQQLWGFGQSNNSYGVYAPAAGGGNVYLEAGETKSIYALDASSGYPAWSTPISGYSVVSVKGDVVYVHNACCSADSVVALNASTGATLWTYSYAGGNNSPLPVAIDGANVYFTGTDGNLYALHAKTGKLIWSEPTSQSCAAWSAPSIANGVLYVDVASGGGGCPQIAAFNASSGALLWGNSPARGSTIFPPPIVANGTLYVANATSCGGNVCAFALPTSNSRTLPSRRNRI